MASFHVFLIIGSISDKEITGPTYSIYSPGTSVLKRGWIENIINLEWVCQFQVWHIEN